MEERFFLYQRAKTDDGTLYEIDWFAPYAEANTKDAVASALADKIPADGALGSIAKFHSTDENGAEFVWEFDWDGDGLFEQKIKIVVTVA